MLSSTTFPISRKVIFNSVRQLLPTFHFKLFSESSETHPYAVEIPFWYGICIQIPKQLKELQAALYHTTIIFPMPFQHLHIRSHFHVSSQMYLSELPFSLSLCGLGEGPGPLLPHFDTCGLKKLQHFTGHSDLKFGDLLNSSETRLFLFYHAAVQWTNITWLISVFG
jgi:hypothetical protein